MTWNHRVVQTTHKFGDETFHTFGIHECYYDENGKIWAASMEPEALTADDVEGLKWSLDKIRKAFESPVLNLEDIPEEGAVSPASEIPEAPPVNREGTRKGGCSKC